MIRIVTCLSLVLLLVSGTLWAVSHIWTSIGPAGAGIPANTTILFVDAAAAANGDGSSEHPFMRITDALDRARAIRRDSAVPIDIQVGPGVYVGSYTNTGSTIELLPIRLDVSHLKLIGTTKMEKDEGGLPTGVIKENSNTLLLADPPLEGMQSILALSSPNVKVENLSFNAGSGHGGWVVRVDQVQDTSPWSTTT